MEYAVASLKNWFRLLEHYKLGQLYEEMSRPDDATRENERFLEMWSQADEGFPAPAPTTHRNNRPPVS